MMDFEPTCPRSIYNMQIRAIELFAGISAADILELPEKEELRGLLKELFKAYEEMVR